MKLYMMIISALLFFFPISFSQIAIKGDLIYTMAGDPIENGVILINNGLIEKISDARHVAIPSGYEIIEGKVITPGLIDSRTVVGLSGIYNYKHDQDVIEKSDAIQPELRAVDAYNKDETLVDFLLSLGITTIHTGHGPGALASGQTMIARTYSESYNDYVLDSLTMVAFTLGNTVKSNYTKPGTRSKGVAMLRSELLKAQEYAKKLNSKDDKDKPKRDLKLEMLAKVLNGEVRALFTVNRSVDIMAALRLADEFDFKPVLDGVAEGYLLLDELKIRDLQIILHPAMVRINGDTKNASLETAKILYEAGISIALQSGYESYVPKTRVVLFEAAIAHSYGLPLEEALASITINAAKLLGIDDSLGSLEEGKTADVVIFDGNPFEYTSHVCKVIVNGKIVKNECF